MSDHDFTLVHYARLLELATAKYPLARFSAIPWREQFLLWRHDVDLSLHRAVALARLEHRAGVPATYFLNLHSDFYNLGEASQHRRVEEILSLGHEIGLHFDSAFYGGVSERELDRLVAVEARQLTDMFGVQPVAFSFHNPNATELAYESETYGGLLNCYGHRFKHEVAYCSDSNGYWRFRRLYDVLNDAAGPRLQVLTHCGWWQDTSMPPRARVFRAAYGRAAQVMQQYDAGLAAHGRENIAGGAVALDVLHRVGSAEYALCDYLWNGRHLGLLFLELWRLCIRYGPLQMNENMHSRWFDVRDDVLTGQHMAEAELEAGCAALCTHLMTVADSQRLESVSGINTGDGG